MQDNKTRIIAECGSNHNGSLAKGILLAKESLKADADFIKFQLVHPRRLALMRGTPIDIQPLDEGEWREIYKSIPFHKRMATVYDAWSIQLALRLDIPYAKISHVEARNSRLIEMAIDSFEKVFVSFIRQNHAHRTRTCTSPGIKHDFFADRVIISYLKTSSIRMNSGGIKKVSCLSRKTSRTGCRH